MPTTPPLPTKIPSEQKPILKKKKKKPSERQNPEEPANHVVTHADLHQTHHRDPRQSHHDLAGHKHWQSPTTNNPLQPQPNHDPNTVPDLTTTHNPLHPYPPLPLSTSHKKNNNKKKKKKSTTATVIHAITQAKKKKKRKKRRSNHRTRRIATHQKKMSHCDV